MSEKLDHVPYLGAAQTYEATARLRWRRPSDTTTEPDVLEQAWMCLEDGSLRWLPIELYVEPSA